MAHQNKNLYFYRPFPTEVDEHLSSLIMRLKVYLDYVSFFNDTVHM